MQKINIESVYQQIIAKASIDVKYRMYLLKDPISAIELIAGEKLPQNFSVKIIEQDPAYDAIFVLPKQVNDMSDNDLDSVAGGISLGVGISACAVALGIGPCPADACAAKLSMK